MNLTPQQVSALDQLVTHMRDPSEKPLIIQGVSGSGKSTLVDIAARHAGTSTSEVHPWRSDGKGTETNDVRLIEFRNAQDCLELTERVRGKARSVIILAHPQFDKNDSDSTTLLDHQQDLQNLGLDTSLLRIATMTDEQTGKYASALEPGLDADRLHMAVHHGLGVAGHIQTLLRMPDSSENRANTLSLAKIWQMLQHAGRFHHHPSSRVEALLEREIPRSYVYDLNRVQSDASFASRFHEILLNTDFPFTLPRFEETLKMYQRIMRDRDCQAIKIFAPDVDQEVIDELYKDDGGRDRGRILEMGGAGGLGRIYIFGRDYISSDTSSAGQREDLFFDPWLAGEEKDLPTPTDRSFLLCTDAHGGCSNIDDPEGMYCIETLLQGKKIPYQVHYNLSSGSVVYEVGAEKVTLVG